MSHHSRGNDRREGSHRGNMESSLQKKRERDKMRRQQQYEQHEKIEEPLFLPMRKTSRQDSLARNISNVLGDVDLVHENWYGTSRSRQVTPEMNNSANNSKLLTSSQRDGYRSTSSRETMGGSSERPSKTDSSGLSIGSRPIEYDGRSSSKSKQQRDSSRDRHGQTYAKPQSDNGKRQRMSPNSKNLTVSQNPSIPSELKDSRDPTVAGIRRSDRDRVSSVDSDMLRVENILEEMVDIPPSITDIKTPIVSELKNFNFVPSAQRKRGTDNTVENSHADAGGLSDEESSEDTSDDEDFNNDNDWNLGSFSKESKPQDSALHSHSINFGSSKTATDTDTHNRSYPDNKSFPRRKIPMVAASENQQGDLQRNFNDKTQSLSASSKSRSKSSSSSQLHTSPRQRQLGAKDTHSSTKQNRDAGTKRHSGPINSSRNEPTARSSKGRPQKSPHNRITGTPDLCNKPSKSHRSDESVSRLGKESTIYQEKSRSVVQAHMKSNSGSTSSSSSESSSEESNNADSSSEEDNSQSVFTSDSAQIENDAAQYSFAKSKSPRMHSPKKMPGSQSENNNSGTAYEQNNSSWSNPHREETKPMRTKPPSSSHEKKSTKSTDHPYKEKHPHILNTTTVKHDTADANLPMANIQSSRYSLWVKLKSSFLRGGTGELFNIKQEAPRPDINIEKSEDTTQSVKRQLGMVSTGSETEQPIRRADSVQVAVADGSTDWKGSSSVNKRKCVFPDQAYDSREHKRQRREKSRWKQKNRSFPGENWTGTDEAKYSGLNTSGGVEHFVDSNEHIRPTSSRMEHESPNSSNLPQRATVSAASVVLPDSSVPGEQERMETSDWYMREGKKMKHEGDGMVDSRNGRTRPGEALSRALAYFEASLLFIMSGHVMESENREERLETGSNSSSSTVHSPTNMYQQTLPLLDFVLKMRPHVEQDDRIFKRMTISCLKCQSYLYFRIFKLKKDIAVKNSEVLTEQFKTVSKSAQTHSPWRNANAAPNVLSPMSPAVPSPFTHHGPSPASSNGDQVSSSTQAGKMTPSQHANYSLPQKMYDTYRQHHTIMCNLLKAHEKWDQGELMMEEHVDFFRNIDALCNRKLTFHSSLRDVYFYYKMVLRQLHALMTSSPST